MSVELLDVLRWLLIVVAAGALYLPLGRYIAEYTQVSLLSSYLIAYITVAVVVKLFFTWVRHAIGEKVVGSDLFGRLEFYLGMAAVALRFLAARSSGDNGPVGERRPDGWLAPRMLLIRAGLRPIHRARSCSAGGPRTAR